MRVALTIDGDASGAQKAAQDAGQAIEGLGKDAAAISKAIEDGFSKAIGALKPLADKGGAAGAANDNVSNTISTIAQKVSELSKVATGAENSLSKAALSAGTLASGVAGVVRSAGAMTILSGSIGVIGTAASIFFDIVNSKSAAAAKNLDEQARLIGVIKTAYRDAANAAGEFVDQSKAVTQLQIGQAIIKLQDDLQSASKSAVGKFRNELSFTGLGVIGTGIDNGELQRFEKLAPIVERFSNAVSAGNGDVSDFRDEIAAIGLAAAKSDPELAALADRVVKFFEKSSEITSRIKALRASENLITGTGDVKKNRKDAGLPDDTDTKSVQTKISEFDRLEKSLRRQAAAQEAETLAIGKSAGESAKLRTEYLLKEAAEISGIKVMGEYADRVKAIGERFGAAAQKAAELRTISDINFERGQLGRSSIDAAVADRLRPVQGDNIDLNSELATAIRFNETMKDLKATTLDVGQTAFRTLKADIDAGTFSLNTLGKAGVNALNSILEKATSKAFESVFTGIFGKLFSVGGFSASGGTGLSLTGTGGLFADGGFTGAGAKHQIAGIVHAGEYVFDQDSVRRVGLGNLARLHRGFADGGFVDGPVPVSPRAALNDSGRGRASDRTSAAPQNVHVTVGVEVDDGGALRAYVKSVSTDASRDAISGFVGSSQFTQAVAGANVRAGKRRLGS